MELLAEEDGWMVLSSLSQEDLHLVAPAVWDALAKVHALSLPGGGAPVLADCRPCNVMVKYVCFDYCTAIPLLTTPEFVACLAWSEVALMSCVSCAPDTSTMHSS